MRFTLRVILLLAFYIVQLKVLAQKKILGIYPLSDTIAEEKQGIFLLPLLYYTPDTRWAFGAAGVYYFKIDPKYDYQRLTRISYVQFLADYTQNDQLDVWSVWNIFTRDENLLLKGELRYRNFPDRFYGIGNTTSRDQEEKYAYDLISVKNLVMKKIKPNLFLGLDYHFESEYGFRYTPGGALEQGTITGYRGGIGSAFGAVGVLDSRDNAINAFIGRYAEFSSYFYSGIWGSTFSFINLNGWYQHYWSMGRRRVLALQSKLRITSGEVPFLDMSTAGNDDILRGYPRNRFRDFNFAGSQIEYRFPLFWRFGMVTFAGIGDVFRNMRDVNFNTLKYSVGSGLRFLVNPAERLNIRFDYAWGREGGYFYFSVAEAF